MSFLSGGVKPADETHWSQIVLVEHRSFVANSVAELSAVFPDVELIVALGCESILNVPVVIDGEVRGTLNCLAEAGHWTPDQIAAAEDLKLLGAVCFLRHELDQKMESER